MVRLQHKFDPKEECFLSQPLRLPGPISLRGPLSTKTNQQQRHCATICPAQATAVFGALSQGYLDGLHCQGGHHSADIACMGIPTRKPKHGFIHKIETMGALVHSPCRRFDLAKLAVANEYFKEMEVAGICKRRSRVVATPHGGEARRLLPTVWRLLSAEQHDRPQHLLCPQHQGLLRQACRLYTFLHS